MELYNVSDRACGSIALCQELSQNANSIELGKSLMLDKSVYTKAMLHSFCIHNCGQNKLAFIEHDAAFEIFPVPDDVPREVVIAMHKETYMQPKDKAAMAYRDKMIVGLKKVIKEYFVKTSADVEKYYESKHISTMQADKVIAYTYLQRKFAPVITSNRSVKDNREKPGTVLKELLEELCDSKYIVELLPEHKGKYETTAKLYGFVEEFQ